MQFTICIRLQIARKHIFNKSWKFATKEKKKKKNKNNKNTIKETSGAQKKIERRKNVDHVPDNLHANEIERRK